MFCGIVTLQFHHRSCSALIGPEKGVGERVGEGQTLVWVLFEALFCRIDSLIQNSYSARPSHFKLLLLDDSSSSSSLLYLIRVIWATIDLCEHQGEEGDERPFSTTQISRRSNGERHIKTPFLLFFYFVEKMRTWETIRRPMASWLCSGLMESFPAGIREEDEVDFR